MEFVFKRIADREPGDFAYDVLIDQVVIGRLERRWQIGRNTVKSYLYSGPGRRVGLWEGTVEHVEGLSDDDRRSIHREITRGKTNRRTAARHLVDAYMAAGVALPKAPPDERAA